MVYILPTRPPPHECAIVQIKSQLRSPTEKANASRAALTENGATPLPHRKQLKPGALHGAPNSLEQFETTALSERGSHWDGIYCDDTRLPFCKHGLSWAQGARQMWGQSADE